jgi:hypothetical protein
MTSIDDLMTDKTRLESELESCRDAVAKKDFIIKDLEKLLRLTEAKLTVSEDKAEKAASTLETFAKLTAVNLDDVRTSVSFEVAEGILAILAESMHVWLKNGSCNYVETTVLDRHNEQEYTLHLQRKSGKTPHQLRAEADERAKQAEERLARYLEDDRRDADFKD